MIRPLRFTCLTLLAIGLWGCDSGENTSSATPPAKSLGTAPPGQSASPWFVDRAALAGLDFQHIFGNERRFHLPETISGGIALLDIEGDGDLDIYCVQGGDLVDNVTGAGNRLFRNDGEFRFVDVTQASGVGDKGYGIGVAVGDIDRDGDPDLYVTNIGANVLYRNEGDGTFTDVTREAGVGDEAFGSSAAFADLDGDRFPELIVANYVNWRVGTEIDCTNGAGERDYCSPRNYRAPAADTVFRNRGDGTFENISEPSGCRSVFGNGLGVAVADFDRDGLPDLYIANDGNANQLWHQDSPLRFSDIAVSTGSAVDMNGAAEAGMGVTACDLDDDGDLDLLLTHLRGETHTFYRNDGNSFTDATVLSGLSAPSRDFTGFGIALGDFDHDGRLDLYVGNGRVMRASHSYGEDPYAEPNQLFRGVGPAQFEEVHPRGGTATLLAHTSRAVACGDLDNDGDLDLVVMNSGEPPYLLENIAPKAGGAITVTLEDAAGLDAEGAIVIATLEHGTLGPESASPRPITRLAGRGGSYAASHDPRIHLGLGSAREVASLEVRWPGGRVEQFGPLAVGSRVTLREGSGIPGD